MAQLAQKQVRISEEDWDRLKQQAEQRRMAVSHLVRLILLSYLDEVSTPVTLDAPGTQSTPDTPETVEKKLSKVNTLVGRAIKRMGV